MWEDGCETSRLQRWGAIALIALFAAAGTAWGSDVPDPMNRVSFQVESSRDVSNDWIQAVIGITDEDVDSARLADRINTANAESSAERSSRSPRRTASLIPLSRRRAPAPPATAPRTASATGPPSAAPTTRPAAPPHVDARRGETSRV